ncbi:MAG TPA: hypothetical protein VFP35_02810 [Candidatus Saccharimonadales bacterium]|nr:hypothetical protein [Candidatus Saccharimonadales bacterium]
MSLKSHHKLKKHTTAPNKQLERLILIVAIVEPLTTIPQILQIYVSRSTGSSIVTWALYLAASVVWLVYGIKTRNLPIIVTDILWVLVEAMVVVGLLVVR